MKVTNEEISVLIIGLTEELDSHPFKSVARRRLKSVILKLAEFLYQRKKEKIK